MGSSRTISSERRAGRPPARRATAARPRGGPRPRPRDLEPHLAHDARRRPPARRGRLRHREVLPHAEVVVDRGGLRRVGDARAQPGREPAGAPSTRTEPLATTWTPTIDRSSVVFLPPDGPRRPVTIRVVRTRSESLVQTVRARRGRRAAPRSLPRGRSARSARSRSASGCRACSRVVTPRSRKAATRSAIRSRSPTRATSSTRASGTAAIASFFFPPR